VVDGTKIGMMVCFDWFFPEVTRVLALKGAQLICHPSSLVMPFCQDAMRTRSLENKVFTVTANRIGTEKRGSFALTFTGKSQVVDPSGDVLASAGERSESLKVVDIDIEIAKNKLVNPNNDVFKDRKISLYKPIVQKRTR
jgi:predicted amidohydrolase